MLTFYLDLLKKSAAQFRQILTPWRFWAWVAGLIPVLT